MLNYQKKYLKYKIKYLELKNQIGGACPNKGKGFSRCELIKFHGCNQTDINITKDELLKCKGDRLIKDFINNTKIRIQDLKKIGFTVQELKKEGFKIYDFMKNNKLIFEIKDLKEAEFTTDEIKSMFDSNVKINEGITDETKLDVKDLKEVGFTIDQINKKRIDKEEIKKVFTDEEIYQ